ncbi:SIMPL domain-containing protein [Rhodovulum strictum]|uniref:DUF541 domain-containing protein n=1 Tax=Rhodovulum strictum TaxID=58314 RepID=A0A844BLG1_9RHOB|nr:SIMPL domain-containing protein [Rhodovulum strictum]MRH21842.1 DUF541 domain-containing protein [Rhodovulum strictum]
MKRQLALLVILAGLALPAAAETPARLTVTGQGVAEAVPDMATITLGVTHEAETAEAAMNRVSAELAAVLDSLRAAGIDPRDLQTAGLSLSPVWSGHESGQRAQITGYSASNTLSVRVRGLDGLGGTLDRALAEGANRFQGLSFGMQNPEPLRDEARRRAVAEALRKAALLAEAAGLTLGPVLSMEEEGAEMPRPMMFEAARMASDAVPVAPGELAIEARVRMVFALGE